MTESHVEPTDAEAPEEPGAERVGPVASVELTPAQAEAIRGVRKLLHLHRRRDLDDLLRGRLGAAVLRPRIIVVGQPKAGKSSLVNALLARRDLLPTGADITTGVFVEVHVQDATVPQASGGTDAPPGTGSTPVATLAFADGMQWNVPVGQIEEWVTIGRRGEAHAAVPPVTAVTVNLTGEDLGGTVVIDTPGVGGIDGGHTQIAVQACRDASTLIFVTDAGRPISSSELQFLNLTAPTVDHVVVAATRIDQCHDHRNRLAELRRVLARCSPGLRTVPVLGVSSELSLMAREQGETIDEELATHSGIPALLAELHARRDDWRTRPAHSLLRTADRALEQVATQVELAARVAQGSIPVADAVTAQQRALAELRDYQTNWTLYLDRDLNRATATAGAYLSKEADRLQTHWRTRLEGTRFAFTRSAAEECAAELGADLTAMAQGAANQLHDTLVAIVSERMADQVGRIVGESAPADPANVHASSVATDLFDPLAAMSALRVGYFASGAGAVGLGVASLGTALLVAVPVMALTTLFQQGRSARQQLIRWTVGEIVRVQGESRTQLGLRVAEVKPDLITVHRRLIAEAVATRTQLLAEAQEAQRSATARSAKRSSELMVGLAAIRAQREALAALLT